jgi:tricorn protease-like protein
MFAHGLSTSRASPSTSRRAGTSPTGRTSSSPTSAPLLRSFDDLVVVSLGGRVRRIGQGLDELAAWSPDGRSITWTNFIATRREQKARDDLFVAAVGGDTKRIVRGAANTRMEGPIWARGGRIVFTAGLLD